MSSVVLFRSCFRVIVPAVIFHFLWFLLLLICTLVLSYRIYDSEIGIYRFPDCKHILRETQGYACMDVLVGVSHYGLIHICNIFIDINSLFYMYYNKLIYNYFVIRISNCSLHFASIELLQLRIPWIHICHLHSISKRLLHGILWLCLLRLSKQSGSLWRLVQDSGYITWPSSNASV